MGGVISWYNTETAPEFCGLLLTRGMSSATGFEADRPSRLGVRSLDHPKQQLKFAPVLSRRSETHRETPCPCARC